MDEDTKALVARLRGDVAAYDGGSGWTGLVRRMQLAADRIERLAQENEALRDWLDGIRQYGSDTLAGPSRDPSGSAFVPDDRNWHREGVLKMMRRAIAAISGDTPEWADEARVADARDAARSYDTPEAS